MPRRAPKTPQDPLITAEPGHEACAAQIEALTLEVRQLKATLAVRSGTDPLAASGNPVKRTSGDFLDGLAPQDRRYMERKMGINKKP